MIKRKSTRIIILIGTIWPVIYMVFFFSYILSLVFASLNEQASSSQLFSLIIPLHIFTMLEIMAITVFYIVNAFQNPGVKKDNRALWVILFFVAGNFAMLVYWYLYIWKYGRKK